MCSFRLTNAFAIVAIFMATVKASYFAGFNRNTDFDQKLCNEIDIVMQQTDRSALHCSFKCEITTQCSGFMYNPADNTCVGCKGNYNNETVLPKEIGTMYYKKVSAQWVRIYGSSYTFSSEKMDFNAAKFYCQGEGGYLARIDSDMESAVVKNIGAAYRNIWIGLTDEGHDGIWKWVNDNSTTNYTNWTPDSPNGENCASINRIGGFKWTDRICSYKSWVLCEKQGTN